MPCVHWEKEQQGKETTRILNNDDDDDGLEALHLLLHHVASPFVSGSCVWDVGDRFVLAGDVCWP